MEEFYREYNESLNNTNNNQHPNNKNNSAKISSSNRSSKGKKSHNSHTKASMTANRGLCGWFKVYPDLHSAIEARERLHPTNNNNNTTSNNSAQSQSNTFNYNQMLLNPYFTEDPIIQESSDSGSRVGIINNKSGNGSSSTDHSSIPIQIQVRLRVFEYIPLDHHSNT